jgi:hypothetical protein
MKEHKGNLWRPIKRLMAKAQYVREMQKQNESSPRRHWRVAGMTAAPNSTFSPEVTPEARFMGNFSVDPGAIKSTTPGLPDQSGVHSTESLDPFFEHFANARLPDLFTGYTYSADIDYVMPNWVEEPSNINFEMHE